MKEFNRMDKKAWKAFSHTIRTNENESTYFCGQVLDEQQWVAIYTGFKGYGVQVLPLYEHKSSYIHNCRVLYQLAEDTQQRKQYIKEAKEWANGKV